MNKKLLNLGRVILAVVILVLIFRELNLDRLLQVIFQIKIEFLCLAMVSYFFMNVSNAYRLCRAFEKLGHKIRLSRMIGIQFFGMLLSDFTPGRAGYLGLSHILKRERGVNVKDSISVLLTIQAIEFLVKVGVSLLALIYLISLIGGNVDLKALIAGVLFLLLCGLGFLFLMWKENRFISRILVKLPYGKRLNKLFEEFKKASREMRNLLFLIASFSILGWIIRGFEWYFLSISVNLGFSFLTALMLQPLLTTIRFIPLTPAGLGIYEGSIIVILSFLGISPETTLIFSFLDRIDNLIVDLIGLKELRNV